MAEPGVTIVVPTLNRGQYLLDSIRDLLAQDHRPLEILIVDQSEETAPALRELAAEHPDLIHCHKVAFRGLPQARNYGWRHARYDVIVFVDDDIRCGPDLVKEHLRALRLPSVGVVAGGIDEAHGGVDDRIRAGTFRRWTAVPLRGFASFEEHEADHAPGGNFSVWRRALEGVGGLDERLSIGAALYEEAEFCLRARQAGFRVYFNGKARVLHLAAGAGGCRVREVDEYVRGLAHNRAILIRRHISWFHVTTAVLRLGLLVFSYAVHYRAAGAVRSGLRGFLEGWRAATGPVRCGDYRGPKLG